MTETKSLAIVPRTLDEVSNLAERLSKSNLLPKAMQGKAPDVLVTIMAGQELGLSPMASLRAIHVIDGTPILSADGMVALVLGSGKAAYFERVEESDTSVTYETLRVGAKSPRRCTWTMEMAKHAALHLKDNWRLYPRSMLASRAKSELARDVFPDVLAGVYSDDEIDSTSRPAYIAPTPVTNDVVDAEIVSETTDPPEIVAIDACETEEALQAHAKTLTSLKGEARKRATVRYKARLELVRKRAQETTPVEVVTEANGAA
jgi:hypothetical protein